MNEAAYLDAADNEQSSISWMTELMMRESCIVEQLDANRVTVDILRSFLQIGV